MSHKPAEAVEIHCGLLSWKVHERGSSLRWPAVDFTAQQVLESLVQHIWTAARLCWRALLADIYRRPNASLVTMCQMPTSPPPPITRDPSPPVNQPGGLACQRGSSRMPLVRVGGERIRGLLR